jgi:DNA primase
MISEATLDRIREATDPVELISAYVRLKKRGQQFVGLCPFHTEKTPSFSVSRERRIYHCFGCGRGGDVIRFLMEHERMGFVEAVRYLAERAHIELEDDDKAPDETGRVQEALVRAAEYFVRALEHGPTGLRARDYLTSRRVSPELAARFGIGFAPDRSRGLITYAARFGLGPEELEAAGLVVQGARGRADRFRNRLMFPIRSVSGKPIAFGGRDLSGQSQAKYMNSPETALYQKGRVLFGLHEARPQLQKRGSALICEGYLDLLRLHEFGFGHSVAVSGTALTTEQARLLRRYVESVVLLFDADAAGQQAALRSVPVLFQAGLDVQIATLPRGQDPDVFLLEQGGSALEERLRQAQGYVEFLETRAGSPFVQLSPGAQERFLLEVADVVSRVDDAVRRDLLIQSAWSKAGIPEEHIRRRLASRGEEAARPAPRAADPLDWREELLCLLLARPELRLQARGKIVAADFEGPLHKQLLTLLLSDEYVTDLPQQLSGRRIDAEILREVLRLASLPVDIAAAAEAFASYLNRAKRQRLSREARQLVSEIGAAERRGDSNEAARLSKKHVAIRREWMRLRGGLASKDPAAE